MDHEWYLKLSNNSSNHHMHDINIYNYSGGKAYAKRHGAYAFFASMVPTPLQRIWFLCIAT